MLCMEFNITLLSNKCSAPVIIMTVTIFLVGLQLLVDDNSMCSERVMLEAGDAQVYISGEQILREIYRGRFDFGATAIIFHANVRYCSCNHLRCTSVAVSRKS